MCKIRVSNKVRNSEVVGLLATLSFASDSSTSRYGGTFRKKAVECIAKFLASLDETTVSLRGAAKIKPNSITHFMQTIAKILDV